MKVTAGAFPSRSSLISGTYGICMDDTLPHIIDTCLIYDPIIDIKNWPWCAWKFARVYLISPLGWALAESSRWALLLEPISHKFVAQLEQQQVSLSDYYLIKNLTILAWLVNMLMIGNNVN